MGETPFHHYAQITNIPIFLSATDTETKDLAGLFIRASLANLL